MKPVKAIFQLGDISHPNICLLLTVYIYYAKSLKLCTRWQITSIKSNSLKAWLLLFTRTGDCSVSGRYERLDIWEKRVVSCCWVFLLVSGGGMNEGMVILSKYLFTQWHDHPFLQGAGKAAWFLFLLIKYKCQILAPVKCNVGFHTGSMLFTPNTYLLGNDSIFSHGMAIDIKMHNFPLFKIS